MEVLLRSNSDISKDPIKKSWIRSNEGTVNFVVILACQLIMVDRLCVIIDKYGDQRRGMPIATTKYPASGSVSSNQIGVSCCLSYTIRYPRLQINQPVGRNNCIQRYFMIYVCNFSSSSFDRGYRP